MGSFMTAPPFHLWVLLMSASLVGSGLQAHESPHDTIHRLTHKIEHASSNAELYYARAIEYKSLGKATLAMADFNKVLKLAPGHLNSTIALARLLTQQSKPDQGLKILQNGIKTCDDAEGKARLLKASSDIHISQKHYPQAYTAIALALDHFPKASDDWFLQQSSSNLQLGELKRRYQQLAIGFRRSGSAVLQNAWIDAKLDADESGDVKALIQKQRADSRFVSSWDIRLAQTLKKEAPERKSLLKAAIAEIDQRLNLDRPDVTLLIDRCYAYHLLDDEDQVQENRQWLTELKVQSFQLDWLDFKLKGTTDN